MKNRILSLIMIIPFIVMLLAFGFSKSVNLKVDLKAEFEWDYAEHEPFEYSSSSWDEGVPLVARVYPLSSGKKVVWSCKDERTFDGTEIDPQNPICTIEQDGDTAKLFKHKNGIVTISAKIEGTEEERSFTAYVIEENEFSNQPEFVILLGTDTKEQSVDTSGYRYFGLYNLDGGELKKNTETFTAMVFPSNASSRSVGVEIEGGAGIAEATVTEPDKSGACKIEVNMLESSDDIFLRLRAYAKDRPEVEAKCIFNVVDGLNVRSYDDLMYATDENTHKKIVLRTNLESSENLENRNNSALFGRRSGNDIVCEYREEKSSYDIRYYSQQKDCEDPSNPKAARIKVGVTFRDDVYGNGYTINAHELCYPSAINPSDETLAAPALSDPFQGPLIFVLAKGCACFGQDNVGFMVKGDGITIDNITLKNCNNVSDLSNLDYVGTVLEVDGDDVTVKNSQILNGRTVVRTMSNKNFNIDACLLSYAREFILKVGSNKFAYAEPDAPITGNPYEFLSPTKDGDVDLTTIIEKGKSDSTVTVKNTFFYTSGVFCVGMDTHFAGNYLHKWDDVIKNMAATSYPSRLDLVGDVRFYDWKDVNGLDSTTLISTTMSGSDGSYDELFDISKILLDEEDGKAAGYILNKDGKKYVHGGVAYFGGGRNLSKVYTHFEDEFGDDAPHKDAFKDPSFESEFLEIKLSDLALSPILTSAAGYGPFKFHMYDINYEGITVGSMPNLGELRAYVVH